jgi:single-strand DNA-binding protein
MSKRKKELNQIVLVGRVGRDPEIRYFESGSSMATFSLAINRPSKNKETDWFDIKLWGKQAEIAGEYVRKGSLIGIEGQLDFDSWNDKNTGELQIKPVVLANNLRLIGSKSDNSSNFINN